VVRELFEGGLHNGRGLRSGVEGHIGARPKGRWDDDDDGFKFS